MSALLPRPPRLHALAILCRARAAVADRQDGRNPGQRVIALD
ncbi:hypothetical protein [Microbacterium sp. bgisy207]